MLDLERQENYSSFKYITLILYNFWGEHQKLMAFYKGYLDESGHETDKIIGCGGLVIDAENPLGFDKAWQDAITPLSYLHTTDFIAGRKDFEEWKGRTDEKIEILERAIEVISQASFQTFSSVLLMEDYRRADAEFAISESIAYPFSLCARFCSVQVNQWADRHGIPGPIRLVLEKRAEGMGEVVEVFERDGLLPPVFDPKETTPLQAADLIAWGDSAMVLDSPNYHRFKKVLAGLPACLHTHDLISYSDLLKICQNVKSIAGVDVLPRSASGTPIAFHTSKKRTRKQFQC